MSELNRDSVKFQKVSETAPGHYAAAMGIAHAHSTKQAHGASSTKYHLQTDQLHSVCTQQVQNISCWNHCSQADRWLNNPRLKMALEVS